MEKVTLDSKHLGPQLVDIIICEKVNNFAITSLMVLLSVFMWWEYLPENCIMVAVAVGNDDRKAGYAQELESDHLL